MSRGFAQPVPSWSRSRRPGRRNSQVSRVAKPARVAGRVDSARVEPLHGRAEQGLEPLAERPRQRQLLARSRRRQRAVPGVAQQLARARGREHLGRHPPPDVQLLGPRHRERHHRGAGPEGDQRGAGAERPDPARRPADGPLGHLGEHGPVADDGPRGRDVGLDADAAPPHREQPAHPVDQDLAPARR